MDTHVLAIWIVILTPIVCLILGFIVGKYYNTSKNRKERNDK